MMKTIAAILTPSDNFLILNLYSNGYSALQGETIVKEAFGLRQSLPVWKAEAGPASIPSAKALPLSIFVRMFRS